MLDKTIPKLIQDPRYPEFVRRYHNDLPRFAKEVCGLDLTYQQIELMQSVNPFGSRTSVSSGHGCFGKGTEIMLFDGSIKPVEDICIGDCLMGDDGTARNVLQLCRGKEKMYRFTYSDGTSHIFNESHILCLIATNSKGKRKAGDKLTITVREWLDWGADKKRCHAIYRNPVVDFYRKQILPIDPYILGVWLGDGNSSKPEIYSADEEVQQAIYRFAQQNGYTVKLNGFSGKAKNLFISKVKNGKFLRKTGFWADLKKLNVAKNKHIPQCYLTSSLEDRKQLLAGLIDTDGNLSKHNFDFIQKNKTLAEQVKWLARSIGCHATIKTVQKKCTNTGAVGTYYRVTIGRNLDFIPTKIKRKQAFNLTKQRSNLHFSIKSVEPLGVGDYYGFELDGNRQFLGGDFTVLHNTGKTASYGVIALWHLTCFYGSITAIIAPNIMQVRKQVFKEIAISINRMKKSSFDWVAEQVELLNESVHIVGAKMYWHVLAKTAPKNEPENLAGLHGDYLLIIVDEASGVEDTHFGVLTGALTDSRNRMVLASQPTRNVGFFYDTHHRLSRHFGGSWNNLTLNSELSPIVSLEFLKEKKLQYSKEQYDIKVKGLFPNKSDGFLLGRSEVEDCFGFNPLEDKDYDWGYVIAIDVGGGDFRDDSVMTVARVCGFGMYGEDARRVYIEDIPVMDNTQNTVNFARQTHRKAMEYDNATIAVDKGGIGAGYIHNLEDLGTPNLHKVVWGNGCFRKDYKETFVNLRTQAIVCMARAIQEKRFGIAQSVIDRYGARIINELTRIPYSYDSKARYQVMGKPEMREKGIPSPDIADTFAFCFLENVHYIATEKESAVENNSISNALDLMEQEFGNLDDFFGE